MSRSGSGQGSGTEKSDSQARRVAAAAPRARPPHGGRGAAAARGHAALQRRPHHSDFSRISAVSRFQAEKKRRSCSGRRAVRVREAARQARFFFISLEKSLHFLLAMRAPMPIWVSLHAYNTPRYYCTFAYAQRNGKALMMMILLFVQLSCAC